MYEMSFDSVVDIHFNDAYTFYRLARPTRTCLYHAAHLSDLMFGNE
jgi:hypothetical protein